MDFSQYWTHADAITRGLYYVLLFMFIAIWGIFGLRILVTFLLSRHSKKNLQNSVDDVAPKSAGLLFDQRKSLAEQALTQQIARYKNKAELGVGLISIIATLAPFVGLLGTIYGVFRALQSIGLQGQAGLAQIAIPVGEALAMTGFGLVVAIPAVFAYHICQRINQYFNHRLHDQAHDVLIDNLTDPASKSAANQQSLNAFDQVKLIEPEATHKTTELDMSKEDSLSPQ